MLFLALSALLLYPALSYKRYLLPTSTIISIILNFFNSLYLNLLPFFSISLLALDLVSHSPHLDAQACRQVGIRLQVAVHPQIVLVWPRHLLVILGQVQALPAEFLAFLLKVNLDPKTLLLRLEQTRYKLVQMKLLQR
jgi:hypothetical protein